MADVHDEVLEIVDQLAEKLQGLQLREPNKGRTNALDVYGNALHGIVVFIEWHRKSSGPLGAGVSEGNGMSDNKDGEQNEAPTATATANPDEGTATATATAPAPAPTEDSSTDDDSK